MFKLEAVECRTVARWLLCGAALLAGCGSSAPQANEPSAQLEAQTRRAAFATAFEVAEGDFGRLELAEDRLLRVVEGDPKDVAAKRALARLLNFRLGENDFSKARLQSDLYRSLLGDGDTAPEELSTQDFAMWCFSEMSGAADELHRGRRVAALARVNKVERVMVRRRKDHPGEIETHAMAGTYWLNLAGLIPIGKRTRRGRAIDALQVQQAHWDEQSVLSRGLGIAPGTRAVFSTWLAELLVADGRADEAHPHFARVITLGATDDATPAMRSLAGHARQRLQTSATGHALPKALPPWPSGAQSCIACHSQTHGL